MSGYSLSSEAKACLSDFERLSALHQNLFRISQPIRESLSKANIISPEHTSFQLKDALQSLLPVNKSLPAVGNDHITTRKEMENFCLCCAALASAEGGAGYLMSAVPTDLSSEAKTAFQNLASIYFSSSDVELNGKTSSECKLAAELIPNVFPLLKEAIKSSSIDAEADDFFADSARGTVGSAILASYQFRWLITEVDCSDLGKLCSFIVPCALIALDHWSPEVKGQAMISIIHLMRNIDALELEGYKDVLLDASCKNIPSSDDVWKYVMEMCMLLLTRTQGRNPRSPWFEKMLNEMLGHLERQPKNLERQIAWLQFIDPIFHAMGLVLLAHFRRIFPLFFLWIHADDDRLVVLVLERVLTILKLTWIRKASYVDRLIDELSVLYKESAVRRNWEIIRGHIVQILSLLDKCTGQYFRAAWGKLKDDPDLASLDSSLRKIM